jgi:phosphatidylserine/phosphatidylglycerophosphate/cardiolipin synthase-like enzyme
MKFLAITIVLITSAFSQANDDYNALFARQEMLQNKYKEAQLSMVDINKTESLKTWFRLFMNEPENVNAYIRAMKSTDELILGKDYRNLLFYLTATGQYVQASHVVGLYMLSAQTLLDNFAKDPQNKFWKPNVVKEVQQRLGALNFADIDETVDCYREAVKSERRFDLRNVHKMKKALNACLKYSPGMNLVNLGLKYIYKSEGYHGAPFPITYSGYVGGNKVELFNHTNIAPADTAVVSEQLELLLTAKAPGTDKLYQNLSVDDFKNLMNTPEEAVSKFFTEEEGFKYGAEHAAFTPISISRHGIFGEVLNSIESAEESVFIDVFWIGGTIGVNLAKTLMNKVIKNPEFKVYIITDNENKFGYGSELDLVYNYLRAFSEKFTDKHFYIAPANVGLKRTALPEFIDLLITDTTVTDFQKSSGVRGLLQNDGFHLLAKSDHTKVFVVDGKNTDHGKAYVGSKNWTDSSGAVNIDEVAKIEGPAVQLILNSFYYDVLESFDNSKEVSTMAGGLSTSELVRDHIKAKFPEHIGDYRHGLKQLLSGMDVIGRNRFKNPISYTNINVPYKKHPNGKSVVAPAQNNIYGTEVSAVEQNVQAILSAKQQILIDDQFLYDPQVIEALKVAATVNKVKVYVLMETLQAVNALNNVAAPIPNNLFVPDLVRLGIPVKWMLAPPHLKDAVISSFEKYGRILSTTFHVKSIGIDGVLESDQASCNFEEPVVSTDEKAPLLITGSANKDVMTMSGGFREYQVAVYDAEATARHDCLFWSRWNSSSAIMTDGMDFDLPQQAIDAGFTEKEKFLEALKVVLFSAYNFTKDFFN